MPKRDDVQVRKVRAELDGAVLALVDWQEVEPMMRLRVEQAIRRAGLAGLLGPVLEDLDRMSEAVDECKRQVSAACGRLME